MYYGDTTHLTSQLPLLARHRPSVERRFCSDPKHVLIDEEAVRIYKMAWLVCRNTGAKRGLERRTIETRQVSRATVPTLENAKRHVPWLALHTCPGSTLITELVPFVASLLSVSTSLEQSVVRGRNIPDCPHVDVPV